MRILSVVGTRPQLIKAAALQPVLRRAHEESFVDTGQHYDEEMAGSFFAELGLARPDHALGVGGGTGTEQVARMLLALEPVMLEVAPDAVLVYGDTNSTLAGALTAAKLGLPVAHVEAGLRSHDRRMPEELNRVLTDHVSRWCFAPTPAAVANLHAEGITEGVLEVGDLMQDLASRVSVTVRDPATLTRIGQRTTWDAPAPMPGRYLFATVHRAENREADAIPRWLAILAAAAAPERPVIVALHPGTRAAMDALGAALPPDVHAVAPQAYRTTLALQLHAAAVLTDSGGIQREAAWLGTPCLVLRESTEWTELLAALHDAMALVGLDRERAIATLARMAPLGRGEADARRRAENLDLRPAGAADAITRALSRP